jgi:hypothetical protein
MLTELYGLLFTQRITILRLQWQKHQKLGFKHNIYIMKQEGPLPEGFPNVGREGKVRNQEMDWSL